MFVRPGRLRLLALVGGVLIALVLAACGSSSNSSSTPSGSSKSSNGNKVGYISVAPVSAGDWEQSNWAGLQAAAKKYNLKVSNQENVAYDQAAAVLARLAPNNNLVIADSSGYEAAVLQVAPRFPKTTFIVVSDLSTTKGLKNVAGWAANWNQLGYLAGAAGCLAAKSAGEPTVGHVNSEPIPAFTRFGAGVKDGTAANSCKFLTSWTNSFTDTAAAKQAASTMIGKGAGAITSTADTGDQGSQAAAAAQNKPFVADYAPIPKTLTSVLINFGSAYDQIGKLWTANQLKPQIYPMSIENGMLAYHTPFAGPGAQVSPQALAIQDKIKSGEIKVDATHQVKP